MSFSLFMLLYGCVELDAVIVRTSCWSSNDLLHQFNIKLASQASHFEKRPAGVGMQLLASYLGTSRDLVLF
jgi:hypothetical protein